MSGEERNAELTGLARKLALSSNVYSDSLTRLARESSAITTISKSLTSQLSIERELLRSTSSILAQTRQLHSISPSIQSMVSANSSFTRMVERLTAVDTTFSSSFRKIVEDQDRLRDTIRGIGLSASITSAFARINTTRMLSASLLAQTKLTGLDTLKLGQLAGVDSAFSRSISTNLGNLTRSYQALINVAATRESLAPRLPLITTYAPVEYFREVEVVQAITVDDDVVDQPVSESLTVTLPTVDELLAQFDNKLVRLLNGARQSLQDDNPDRARHVTTSVRELFTQVLHSLAPDSEIEAWTTNPDFFHDNRPTRRARLLYICRHIDCDPLSRFVQDDVQAALSFINALNAGTHVVESRLTGIQLSSIVSRMESLLVFLLQLSNQ